MAKKLAEYGRTAAPDALDRILLASQRAGVARRRPLSDEEFLAIAAELGVTPAE